MRVFLESGDVSKSKFFLLDRKIAFPLGVILDPIDKEN